MKSNLRTAAIGAAGAAGVWGAVQLWNGAQVESRYRRLPKGKRFLILGAGFGGTSAAVTLARLLPRRESGSITLVDGHSYLLFTPMLTEVLGGELDGRHVVAPPQRLSPRVFFERGQIDNIDIANRHVMVTAGSRQQDIPEVQRALEADHLLIALGSVMNFHNIPGAQQNALTIKSLHEAIAIRNRTLELLQRASQEGNEDSRRELLTFVVAGGGYTGVETMAALNDLVRSTARDYARIRDRDICTLIVEPGDRLMSETTPELSAYAHRKLQERGVRVMLKTKLTCADPAYVEIDGKQRIRARTLIWAGGVKPHPLIEKLDCRKGKHGGIVVDATCAVPDRPGVWAIGDCAEVPRGNTGSTYAPTAQNATREGRHVAGNIVNSLMGEPPSPFVYQPVGELALVGKRAGVARIYGMEFSGFPAWAMWRAVYLSKMPESSQRFRIAFDWLADLAFGRNLAEIPY